jgi:hypothetical protein
MPGDILLESCKEGAPAFQEDDGDGKVPVSALTRRDDHWPGGITPTQLTVEVISTQSCARCPGCGNPSEAVHCQYRNGS